MAKTYEVSLEAMKQRNNETNGLVGAGVGSQQYTNINDELVIKAEGDINCLQTYESYSLPLRIDLTAKTDSTNIRLYYKCGEVIFNWECNTEELRVHDILTGNNYGYPNMGSIPTNEYVDITWVIEKKFMEIYVNGQLRMRGESYPYIGLLMLEPNRMVSEPIRVSSAWGSTVTVKSLKVTEL